PPLALAPPAPVEPELPPLAPLLPPPPPPGEPTSLPLTQAAAVTTARLAPNINRTDRVLSRDDVARTWVQRLCADPPPPIPKSPSESFPKRLFQPDPGPSVGGGLHVGPFELRHARDGPLPLFEQRAPVGGDDLLVPVVGVLLLALLRRVVD